MRLASRLVATLEGVAIAFESIRSNKIRAALTIMGVGVGVFVVVVMAGAVYGIKAGVEADIAASGPTSFFIFRRGDFFENCPDEESCPSRRNPAIEPREVEMLNDLPNIEVAAAHVNGGSSFKYHDHFISSASIDAYTSDWYDVDGGTIEPGRNFTSLEVRNASRVVILNDVLAKELFGELDPMGKSVAMNGLPFKVIGIYHSNVSFIGTPTQSPGDQPKAIVPLETGRRYLDLWMRGLDVTVKPRDGVDRQVAMDEVIAALRAVRGLRPSEVNDFAVIGQDALMEQFNGFTNNFFLIMIALASVGLLVGGVGVIAIMMISVTERTREIGVRKALGATRSTILWQFLVEASTLTSIGAAVGLAIGACLIAVLRAYTPVPAAIPSVAVMMSLIGAALTGIVFGLLPAMRAARLDPVEALRYE